VNKKDRIIIALDIDKCEKSKNIIRKIDEATFFKVGLQSFIKFGNELLSLLHERNKKIFLDLKFFDIPNTVSGAIKSSIKYNPYFLTIHLLGGREMIKSAIDSANGNTNIVGVSILTSFDDDDLFSIGIKDKTESEVLRLIELGLKSGLKYFVCSGIEIEPIRKRFGYDIKLITPGIRPEWSVKGDQKRVLTPKKAIELGSDYLVIGRPIIESENPLDSFNKIISEI